MSILTTRTLLAVALQVVTVSYSFLCTRTDVADYLGTSRNEKCMRIWQCDPLRQAKVPAKIYQQQQQQQPQCHPYRPTRPSVLLPENYVEEGPEVELR